MENTPKGGPQLERIEYRAEAGHKATLRLEPEGSRPSLISQNQGKDASPPAGISGEFMKVTVSW